jgi:ABC-type transporter Mla subunit MlaD
MIERLTGDDADIIIETRWPCRYNEDQIIASARHHRDVVADTLNGHAKPYLQIAHREATDANTGRFAQASATKIFDHIRVVDDSMQRHHDIADQLEAFAATVVESKQRINEAVHTFTADWAKAPQLGQSNNWYQHELNRYRSQLVDTGRATVTQALQSLAEAHWRCSTLLKTALDQ